MHGKKTITIFISIALLIVVLHFGLHWWKVLGKEQSIFYLDEQITLGSVYTIVLAFLAGYLHINKLSTGVKMTERIKITTIAAIFFAFMLDEYLEIHEYLNTLVKSSLHEGTLADLANLSWIFPLSIIIFSVFAIFIWNFITERNKYAKYSYLAGSLMFVLVIILELAGASSYGNNSYLYFVGFEEGLEMLAMSMFVLAGFNSGLKEE
ncbi:hypothetical protein KC909_01335 [Candidatus Dojkabacteria bacterium]|uniref:Uncharacterized protein n=1 Tax=Candidatus Dojkabacteria bacterium TaxID=2099670 RepID=A0A955L4Q6_9BACT|nr:hypothetical protein [Candidatus Dojkabacteria bacterium]